MDAIVLHNPTSGRGNVAADDLLAALSAGGLKCRYRSTDEPDFAAVLDQPASLVVAAGGDGTVVKVVGAVRPRRLPIAILPLGGANNIARSLGIDGDPFELARAGWRDGALRRLDVGLATGPWGRRLFVEAVEIGAVAEAMTAIDLQDVAGPEKSELARAALLELLAAAQPKALPLTIDGQHCECRSLLGEIMNIPATGPRLRLAPAADPGDGLLDLVYLPPRARAAMLSWLEAGAEGVPPLATRRGRAFAFEWQSGRLHISDSFPPPPERPARVEVALLPEPAKILVPAGAPRLEGRSGQVV